MKSHRSFKGVSLDILKSSVISIKIQKYLPRRKSRLGRPSYSPLKLFLAHLLKIRENFQYDTILEQKLKENYDFRNFCGFSIDNVPSHDTFSRFFRNLTDKLILKIISNIDDHLRSLDIFKDDELALDATDVLSNSRNRHNPDKDAGFGYKTDKERFHGYWAYFVTGTKSEIPRTAWVLPASTHQSNGAMILFDNLENQNLDSSSLMIMDGAFDDKKCYSRCIENGLIPAISYNQKKSTIKYFNYLRRNNWRKRALGSEGVKIRNQSMKLRASVERFQSTFKDVLKGRSVPVRGITKVRKFVLMTCIYCQLVGKSNWMRNKYITRIKRNSLYEFF